MIGPQLRARLTARLTALGERALERVRRHRILGELYEAIDGSFGDFARDHGPVYAGALAFYGVLSLIPLVVLFASLSGFALAGDDSAVEASLRDVLVQLRKVIPYIEPRIEDDLRAIIHNRRSLGAVGLVALLVSASGVFRAMEFALARIFARLDYTTVSDDEVRPRNFLKSKLWFGAFFTAVVIIGIALRVALAIAQRISTVLSLPAWLAELVGDPVRGSGLLGAGLTAASMVVGFVVLLKVFTHREVHTRFAAAGGALFYVLFQTAHALYDVYLARITNVGAMYGSFAAPMIVILWIYFTSTVLLFCCHVTKVLQRRALLGPRWPKDRLALWG